MGALPQVLHEEPTTLTPEGHLETPPYWCSPQLPPTPPGLVNMSFTCAPFIIHTIWPVPSRAVSPHGSRSSPYVRKTTTIKGECCHLKIPSITTCSGLLLYRLPGVLMLQPHYISHQTRNSLRILNTQVPSTLPLPQNLPPNPSRPGFHWS